MTLFWLVLSGVNEEGAPRVKFFLVPLVIAILFNRRKPCAKFFSKTTNMLKHREISGLVKTTVQACARYFIVQAKMCHEKFNVTCLKYFLFESLFNPDFRHSYASTLEESWTIASLCSSSGVMKYCHCVQQYYVSRMARDLYPIYLTRLISSFHHKILFY